jgi:hypothetical protein
MAAAVTASFACVCGNGCYGGWLSRGLVRRFDAHMWTWMSFLVACALRPSSYVTEELQSEIFVLQQ